MASATLGALATELASASWARCKRRWTILGMPPEEAEALAKNPTVGAPGPNVRARLGRPVTVITAGAGSGKSLLLDRLMQRAIARYREQEGAPLPVFIDATRVEGPLREAVARGVRSLGRPDERGAAVFLDGLEEVGRSEAGRLLDEAHYLPDVWPNTTVVTAGRPLQELEEEKERGDAVAMPELDLLGLKTHTALEKAARMVSGRLGRKVEPLVLPPDDKATYRLIRSGETVGLFQLESPGQMALQRRLKARRLQHIVAGISLFRPGPLEADLVTSYVARKRGREHVSYPLTEIEEILRETYGVLIYQEQVLEIARAVAGFTLAEGDQLRRAMTRDQRSSGREQMREVRRDFVRRALARGVPPTADSEVFSWMEGFGRYGFSAAHAASFAEISYASAYMIARWPAETLAEILNSQPMGFYSPRVLLNEARRKGIRVLPPDVHRSGRASPWRMAAL